MNETIKNKWISALRSGEYGQTTGSLRFDDAYCCLGVLCDIAVKNGVIGQPIRDEDLGSFTYGENDEDNGSSLVLPERVAEWAGLPSENPWVSWEDNEGEHNGPISNPNDDGLTFGQIADIIENQL